MPESDGSSGRADPEQSRINRLIDSRFNQAAKQRDEINLWAKGTGSYYLWGIAIAVGVALILGALNII
jgi:hypothetical protein